MEHRLWEVIGSSGDWNITNEPRQVFNNREIKLSRGKYGESLSIVFTKEENGADTNRFLGGSSGVNGTLCVRGVKEDFDDWGIPGWTGDEVFNYMSKVFLPKVLASSLADHIFFARLKLFTASLGFKPMQNMAPLALSTLSLMI